MFLPHKISHCGNRRGRDAARRGSATSSPCPLARYAVKNLSVSAFRFAAASPLAVCGVCAPCRPAAASLRSFSLRASPRSRSLARRVGGGWAGVHSALNVLHLKLQCYTEQERIGQNSCFTVDKSAIHRVGTQTEKTANLQNSPTPAAPRRSARTLRKRVLTNRPQCDIILVRGLLRSNQTLSNPRHYVGSVQETDIRCRSLFLCTHDINVQTGRTSVDKA